MQSGEGNPLVIHLIINSFGKKWPDIRMYMDSREIENGLICWSGTYTWSWDYWRPKDQRKRHVIEPNGVGTKYIDFMS